MQIFSVCGFNVKNKSKPCSSAIRLHAFHAAFHTTIAKEHIRKHNTTALLSHVVIGELWTSKWTFETCEHWTHEDAGELWTLETCSSKSLRPMYAQAPVRIGHLQTLENVETQKSQRSKISGLTSLDAQKSRRPTLSPLHNIDVQKCRRSKKPTAQAHKNIRSQKSQQTKISAPQNVNAQKYTSLKSKSKFKNWP